jgi:hypothetical protein
MKRQWHIRRQSVPTPDGQQRWDRAYQALLLWSALPTLPATSRIGNAQSREGMHENRDLRPRLDTAAGAGTDD